MNLSYEGTAQLRGEQKQEGAADTDSRFPNFSEQWLPNRAGVRLNWHAPKRLPTPRVSAFGVSQRLEITGQTSCFPTTVLTNI